MEKLNEYQEYSGKQVNEAGIGPLVKLTNITETHNGFTYQTGLNVDTLEFKPSGSCNRGGFYCCAMSSACNWLDYGSGTMHFYRMVTLPDDARVWVEEDKFKVNRFVLSERKTIFDDEELFKCCLEQSDNFGSYNNHFKFNRSFYTKDVWRIILSKTSAFIVSQIPKYLITNEVLLQTMLDMTGNKINPRVICNVFPVEMLTDDIWCTLAIHGLKFLEIPFEKERFALRGFILARKLDQVKRFRDELFHPSLADGVRITRELDALFAEKGIFLTGAAPPTKRRRVSE